jgi:hypothetical protein
MYTTFNNVYEVFWYLKQISILNGSNLDEKIFIFNLNFLFFKFENLVILIYIFYHILGLDFS